MLHQLKPNVIWNKVGLQAEEALLIAENSNTQIFIVSGQTGVVLPSRLQTGRSLDDLAAEMQKVFDLNKSQVLPLLQPFIQQLESHELVMIIEPDQIADDPADLTDLPDWPSVCDAPSLNRLEIDELVDQELVALGSFQGGTRNTSGTWSCWGGQAGGVNDTSGNQPCRPGAGYGFLNGGYASPTCSS